jgi:hypothetical protein
MYQVINSSTYIVEQLCDIYNVCCNGKYFSKVKPIGIVFFIQLIHGMGCLVLGELRFTKGVFSSLLLMFNVGVEMGQISIIVAAYAC